MPARGGRHGRRRRSADRHVPDQRGPARPRRQAADGRGGRAGPHPVPHGRPCGRAAPGRRAVLRGRLPGAAVRRRRKLPVEPRPPRGAWRRCTGSATSSCCATRCRTVSTGTEEEHDVPAQAGRGAPALPAARMPRDRSVCEARRLRPPRRQASTRTTPTSRSATARTAATTRSTSRAMTCSTPRRKTRTARRLLSCHLGRTSRSWWCTVTDTWPAAASARRRLAYDGAWTRSSGRCSHAPASQPVNHAAARAA